MEEYSLKEDLREDLLSNKSGSKTDPNYEGKNTKEIPDL